MQDMLMYLSIAFGVLGVIFSIKVLLNVSKVAKIKEDLLNFNASDLDVTHIKSFYQTQVKGNRVYSGGSKIGGFAGVQEVGVVESNLVDNLEVSLDDLQFVPQVDRKDVANRVAHSSVLVNEIDVGTTMLQQEDSKTQPMMSDSVTQPLQNDETTQPLIDSEETQPLMTEEVTHPLINEEVTEPLLKSEVTEPLLKEESTEPLINKVDTTVEERTQSLIKEDEETQPLMEELTQPLNK